PFAHIALAEVNLAPQRLERGHSPAQRELRLQQLAAAAPAQAHHRQLLLRDRRERAVERRFRDLRVSDRQDGAQSLAPDEQRRLRAPDVADARLLPRRRQNRRSVCEARAGIERLGLIEAPFSLASTLW